MSKDRHILRRDNFFTNFAHIDIPRDNVTYRHYIEYKKEQLSDNSDIHKTKHWVAKVFRHSEEVMSANHPHTPLYQCFIEESLIDAYLCRAYYQKNQNRSKGKLTKTKHHPFIFISRIPALDNQSSSYEELMLKDKNATVYNHHFSYWLAKNKKAWFPVQRSKGLVKALAYCMLVNNYDTKLENFSAHTTRTNNAASVVVINPFDLVLSLGNSNNYQKQWTFADFHAVICGTEAKSDTARALLETISGFGTRTTNWYNNPDNFATQSRWQEWNNLHASYHDTVLGMIRGELNEIDPSDHRKALLSVFEETLSFISANREVALSKVKKNLDKVLIDEFHNLTYFHKKLDLFDEKLKVSVDLYSDFLRQSRHAIDADDAHIACEKDKILPKSQDSYTAMIGKRNTQSCCIIS